MFENILVEGGPFGTLLVSKGAPVVVIFNTSLTDNVYLSANKSVNLNGTQFTTLRPLGTYTVSGMSDVYGVTDTGKSVTVEISPATSTTPAPSDIAAQIATSGLMLDTTGNKINGTLGTPAQSADVTGLPVNISNTGVPLLTKTSKIVSGSFTNLAPGSDLYLGPYSVNQIGYEAFFRFNISGSATDPLVVVTIEWIDSTSGLTVDVEEYSCYASAGTYLNGSGPCKADTFKLTLQAFDQNYYVTGTYSINQISRLLARPIYKMYATGTPPGYTLPNFDVGAGILAVFNNSVGAGVTVSRLIPLYNGIIQFSFIGGNTGSISIDVPYAGASLNPVDYNIYSTSVSNGEQANNQEIMLPRAQVVVSVYNKGTASGTFGFTMIIKEFT